MSNLEQLEQSEQLDKSDKYEQSEKSEKSEKSVQSEKLVLTVRKRRRLGKRDREKRRRMLGMENVTGSRTSAEYRSKLKNETQKVIDSLKATNSKPGQKLRKYLKIELDLKINPTQKDDKIETGNVMIVETSEQQSSSSKPPEKPSSDNIEQIGGGTEIDNIEFKNPKNPESSGIFWDSPPLEFDLGVLVQKPFKAEQIEFDRINNGEFETPESTDKICVSPSLEFEQNGSMEVPENNGFEGCDEIVTDLIDEPEMDKFQKNVEILDEKSEGEGDGAGGEGVSNGGGHQGEQMKEESGGGFSDWIKYNRELKKNQPPPEVPKVGKPRKTTLKVAQKIPKSKASTEKPRLIRYRYEENDLVRKSRNYLKGSDYVYQNKMPSKCLIFKNGEESDEVSMMSDVRNLTKLFTDLNYSVELAENLTAPQMVSKIEKFAASKAHGDSAILVFINHGDAKGIYCADKTVFDLESVYSLLSPANCPLLANKPKLVFSENCRGKSCDAGYAMGDESGEHQQQERSGGPVEKSGKRESVIPSTGDFLISYATSANHVAWASNTYGSYHVQMLCRTIAQKAHQYDLARLLVEVRNGLSKIEIRSKGKFHKQMPEVRSTLSKSFFFNTVKKTEKQQSKDRRQ